MPSNEGEKLPRQPEYIATVDMTMFAWLPLVHITEMAQHHEGVFISSMDGIKALHPILGKYSTTILNVAFKTEQQSVEFAAAMRQRLNQNRN